MSRRQGQPVEFRTAGGTGARYHLELYFVCGDLPDLEAGVYHYAAQDHPGATAIELLRPGEFRREARRLAFFQDYAADAHVNSYYLVDLDSVLARCGNRGYGLVQLESALFAGRLHLAAHAVGLRALGSTSLDDEVVEFFSPRASGSNYMDLLWGTQDGPELVVACARQGLRPRVGNALPEQLARTRWDHVGILEPRCVVTVVKLGLRPNAGFLVVQDMRGLQWTAEATTCSSQDRWVLSHSRRVTWI